MTLSVDWEQKGPRRHSGFSLKTVSRRLAGDLTGDGFSFEWFEFQAAEEARWSEHVADPSLKVCFNLKGHGEVTGRGQQLNFVPELVGLYGGASIPFEARRRPKEQHRFLSLQMSRQFLREHLAAHAASVHPLVRSFVECDGDVSRLLPLTRMTSRQRALALSCGNPPVLAAAQPLWYECKAMELAVEFLFQPMAEELFCVRQKRLARDRVDRTLSILKENLAEPPSLEEMGRKVGCSPFYLSRIFSQEMEMTIPQYLRRIRMERAAELLASGKFNVTEAALEVGYSSLSHFSQAFCQTIGCCPNLYPKARRSMLGP